MKKPTSRETTWAQWLTSLEIGEQEFITLKERRTVAKTASVLKKEGKGIWKITRAVDNHGKESGAYVERIK